ncbi:hypothetical protein BAY61_15755 [Prauserella marina]|uniref:Uncharacterized conserved protein YeaO, DUF488 family n=1 Tax=Prauserella marina TaxID=530584 RepID=A0A222VQN9_9PSEU|nr:DUF488 family protein [Prauserella marina]ASR36220.1 hypothetical protein BAY61_15755 [Prauserella marina]PWV76979.1 uncharacterized protein YeaO (DUF488 family) [Prauserella marina]SDD01582.1 Uncharacterized conserved protein YeaO, DUF488 family [Prauserella marina]
MSAHPVKVRRVYDDAERDDGTRVLVDRIWPRGIRKSDLPMHEWLKDVAPSTELRTWYGHDPAKFEAFRERYRAELDTPEGRHALARLRTLLADDALTLLTATKDVEHSHATVLAGLLRH